MNARRRTAVLLEVLGIYLAGQLVVDLVTRALGVHLVNPLARFTVDISDAELVTASGEFLVLVMFQYAGWFLLIVPINWWDRRRRAADYGLTTAGHSWRTLMLAGLAAVALGAWPVLTVELVDSVHHLGDTVAWREALFATSWGRWEFWLFTAVMSWGVIAVLEELFFRGYCQRRLAEEWGDGAAIVATACMFTFAHSQYMIPNLYNIGMVASLLTLAMAFGVVFAWTRSLIPSIIAHAIINVPMTPSWQAICLVLFATAAFVIGRRPAAVLRQVWSGATARGCALLSAAGTAYVIAARHVDGVTFIAAGLVAGALVLELRDRQRRSAARAVLPSA